MRLFAMSVMVPGFTRRDATQSKPDGDLPWRRLFSTSAMGGRFDLTGCSGDHLAERRLRLGEELDTALLECPGHLGLPEFLRVSAQKQLVTGRHRPRVSEDALENQVISPLLDDRANRGLLQVVAGQFDDLGGAGDFRDGVGEPGADGDQKLSVRGERFAEQAEKGAGGGRRQITLELIALVLEQGAERFPPLEFTLHPRQRLEKTDAGNRQVEVGAKSPQNLPPVVLAARGDPHEEIGLNVKNRHD